jgi:hypothetical protein
MTGAIVLLLAIVVLAGPGRQGRAQDEIGPADSPHGDFLADCTLCHSDDGWTPLEFGEEWDHAAISGFPLAGAHAAADCMSCHRSLDFTEHPPSDCVGCHQDVHLGELGTDCGRCHTARSFIDRALHLRMHRMSRFPLTGAHVTLDCERCHRPVAAGKHQWVGLPTVCEGCHRDDFRRTTDPDHEALGFPMFCDECHTTRTWEAGPLTHPSEVFPLTGAHRGLNCSECHESDDFRAAPTDCVGCHLDDYLGTTDPNHVVARFPTRCDECHTTVSWDAARFDHDALYFPIYSGTHRGVWSACSDCHQSSTSFRDFTCLTCHDRADTDEDHQGVPGYGYDSRLCLQCHPDGRQ